MGKRNKQSKKVHSCSKCSAICCQYVAIEIDKPTTRGDFEDIRWYIAHQDIWVFVEGEEWYVCIERPCKFLSKNNKCTMYENRPRICRKYNTVNCERNGSGMPYDVKFSTPEEIQKYAEAYLREKRAKTQARYRRLRVR
jgi:Fe-S-cluster containining protein